MRTETGPDLGTEFRLNDKDRIIIKELVLGQNFNQETEEIGLYPRALEQKLYPRALGQISGTKLVKSKRQPGPKERETLGKDRVCIDWALIRTNHEGTGTEASHREQ